jgi:hypothetical protein
MLGLVGGDWLNEPMANSARMSVKNDFILFF